QPHGAGRLALALGDRQDAAAQDLGEIRRFIERQADDGGLDDVEAHQAELGQAGVDDDELHQERRAAEDPDVDLRRAAQRLVPAEPHDREQQADQAAQHQGADRQPDRPQRAFEKIEIGEVAPEALPIPDFHGSPVTLRASVGMTVQAGPDPLMAKVGWSIFSTPYWSSSLS